MPIQENDWAVVQLPSGTAKMVRLGANDTVSLGKFGSFRAGELLGQPFDVPYVIGEDGRVRRADARDIPGGDARGPASETRVTNQHLADAGTAQRLSHSDIEAMKDSGMARNDLIGALAANSATFDGKTDFAKLKYLKRKHSKFARRFVPRRPCAASLCEMAHLMDPLRYKQLRLDSLSQLLTLANVRAGGRHLVVDDVNNLALAAVLDRTGGRGHVTAIREQSTDTRGMLEYVRYDADALCEVNLSQAAEFVVTHGRMDAPEDVERRTGFPMHDARREKLRVRADRARGALQLGHFDSLLVAGAPYRLSTLLTLLAPLLSGSCAVAVYAQSREPLLELAAFMRQNIHFANVQIREPALREYQLPVDSPGTHPFMTYSGSGGVLLSAVFVHDTLPGGSGGGDDCEISVAVTAPPSDADVERASKRARVSGE